MPGPVVHTIIVEHLPGELDSLNKDEVPTKYRRALVYGSQGPDPFFFNPNDLTPMSVAGRMNQWSILRGQFSVRMYEVFKPVRDLQRDLTNRMEQGVETLADTGETREGSQILNELKNLKIRIGALLTVVGRIVGSFVKKTILDQADPFGLYISPLQTCGQVKSFLPEEANLDELKNLPDWEKDLSGWWWFDNLHSRRTGAFTTELLDIATGRKEGADGETEERPLLRWYAIGYLSHLAADVVGHAYVNSITGGPYRLNQAQRHTTQEKVMDVWAYNRYYSEGNDGRPDNFDLEVSLRELGRDDGWYYESDELVDCAMHRNFQFTIGEIGPRDWERDQSRTFKRSRRKPITEALKLPDEIAENFALAANRAYPDAFGTLTPDEVAVCYRGWYRNFRSSTTSFSPAEPSELPGTDLTGPLEEELRELANETEDVPDAVRNVIQALFDNDVDLDLQNATECVGNVLSSTFGGADVSCAEGVANAIHNFMTNLARAVANLFKQVADLAIQLVQFVETVYASLTLRVLNFLLQKLYEALWSGYRNNLMLITAIGFGSMYSEDLEQKQLRNLWDPEAPDASDPRPDVGRTPNAYIVDREQKGSFPRKGLKAGRTVDPANEERLKGLENDAHLLVPFSDTEDPETLPGPTEYGTNRPEVFINDPNDVLGGTSPRQVLSRQFPALRKNLDVIPDAVENTSTINISNTNVTPEVYRTPDGDSDDATYAGAFSRPLLGDAVTLTAALLKRYRAVKDGEMAGAPVPNLNMSGDRAIGYPTWANKNGCSGEGRQRWSKWHGNEVPWLDEPIDPVFVPDVNRYY